MTRLKWSLSETVDRYRALSEPKLPRTLFKSVRCNLVHRKLAKRDTFGNFNFLASAMRRLVALVCASRVGEFSVLFGRTTQRSRPRQPEYWARDTRRLLRRFTGSGGCSTIQGFHTAVTGESAGVCFSRVRMRVCSSLVSESDCEISNGGRSSTFSFGAS